MSTCILLLVLLKSPSSPLFKDRHSCVSFFWTTQVIQSCKWNDLCVRVFPRILCSRSLVQWLAHYVGGEDSREEDGFSEEHTFWLWGTQLFPAYNVLFSQCLCFLPFILRHWSMTMKESLVLITSAVHVRVMNFIVFEVVGATLRSGLFSCRCLSNVMDNM